MRSRRTGSRSSSPAPDSASDSNSLSVAARRRVCASTTSADSRASARSPRSAARATMRAWPCSAVTGVLSSCEASATKRCCSSAARAARASRRLKARARRPSSSRRPSATRRSSASPGISSTSRRSRSTGRSARAASRLPRSAVAARTARSTSASARRSVESVSRWSLLASRTTARPPSWRGARATVEPLGGCARSADRAAAVVAPAPIARGNDAAVAARQPDAVAAACELVERDLVGLGCRGRPGERGGRGRRLRLQARAHGRIGDERRRHDQRRHRGHEPQRQPGADAHGRTV